MNVEEERQKIMELWDSIIKSEDVNTLGLPLIWEHKGELGELEARVGRLEPRVIEILEEIPKLRIFSPKYTALTEELIKLLHHIKPTEEWMHKIRNDLDRMSDIIRRARRTVRDELLAQEKQRPTVTDDDKNKLLEFWKSNIRFDEFKRKVGPLGFQCITFTGVHPISGEDRSTEDIWIVTKGGESFLLPVYNLFPAPGVGFFYKARSGSNPKIKNIIKLAKVEFKDGKWRRIEWGEVG